MDERHGPTFQAKDWKVLRGNDTYALSDVSWQKRERKITDESRWKHEMHGGIGAKKLAYRFIFFEMKDIAVPKQNTVGDIEKNIHVGVS